MPDLPDEQIATINEFGEAEAQANSFLCAPPEYVRRTRLEVNRIGSVFVGMIPVLDTPFFNRILGLGVGEPATEAMLDEAITVFKNASCKNYMAQVSPLAQPAQCEEWLVARGFKASRNWAKMYRGDEAAPVIPTDLHLAEIGIDQAEAFADVVTTAFEIPAILRPLMKGVVGKPGWRNFIAFEGEKPASAASLFISGEVGWVGNMGTLKKYRKRGAQGALFARCIQDGLALGCKWFVTETGEDMPEDPNPSYHNMLRSGFKLAYLRRNYIHQLPASPVETARRALLVAEFGLRYEWQRFWKR